MMKISSQLYYYFLTLAIGVMLTIQTALNTQMRMYLHSPFQPAFFSF